MTPAGSKKLAIAGLFLILVAALVFVVQFDSDDAVVVMRRSEKDGRDDQDHRSTSKRTDNSEILQFEDLKNKNFSGMDFASPEGEKYHERITAWFRESPGDALNAALGQDDVHAIAMMLFAGRAAFIKDPSLFRELSVALAPEKLRFCHAEFLRARDVAFFRSLLEGSSGDPLARESLLRVVPREQHYFHIGDMLAGIHGWSKDDASALVSATLSVSPNTQIDSAIFDEITQMNLTQPAKDSLIASLAIKECTAHSALNLDVLQKIPGEVPDGAIRWFSQYAGTRFGWQKYLSSVLAHEALGSSVKGEAVRSAITNGAGHVVMDLVATPEFQTVDGVHSLVEMITKNALNEDANRASIWIANLPPGDTRDSAITVMLDYLRIHGDLDSFEKWRKLKSK